MGSQTKVLKTLQIVSPQCDEERSRANQDHVGRLCGLASGSAER
jgi:hypothetical protein